MRLHRLLLGSSLLLPISLAQASLGIFEHGNGIKSMSMGGLTYAYGEETIVMSANPAHAAALGNRDDLGLSLFLPMSTSRIYDNAIAPDSETDNDGRRWYAIPQGGFTRVINERWTWGVTAYAAGLGPDYRRNPYQRFGGSTRGSLFLQSFGAATVLAWQVDPQHALGASLNLGYQSVAIEGLGFLGAVSSAPDKVSN